MSIGANVVLQRLAERGADLGQLAHAGVARFADDLAGRAGALALRDSLLAKAEKAREGGGGGGGSSGPHPWHEVEEEMARGDCVADACCGGAR